MRRGRGVAALVLVLSLPACGDVGRPGSRESGLDLRGEAVPLPAEQVGDLRLTRLDHGPPGGPDPLPVVVTEVGGGAVAVSLLPPDRPPTPSRSLAERGEPGPLLADGRFTIALDDGPFRIRPSLAVEVAPGEVVTASGRGRTLAELAEVLAQVTLPLDGPSAVPGRVLGLLHEPDPGAVRAFYDGGGRGAILSIEEATTAQQAAYRAILHPHPETSIDPMTEASCCTEGILEPAREVEVGDRVGLLATLSPYERILIVEGDPGLVLRDPYGGEALDQDIVAVAAAVIAGSPAEREEVAAALMMRARDQQVAATSSYERSLGWEVLSHHDAGEVGVVLSTGTVKRPDQPDARARLCAAIAVGAAACIPDGSPTGLVLAEGGFDLIFGAVSASARTVDIEFPEATVAAELIDLDPRPGLPERVFIAYITVGDQIEFTGVPSTDRMAQIQVVARDADGRELARLPLFPGLQVGAQG